MTKDRYDLKQEYYNTINDGKVRRLIDIPSYTEWLEIKLLEALELLVEASKSNKR